MPDQEGAVGGVVLTKDQIEKHFSGKQLGAFRVHLRSIVSAVTQVGVRPSFSSEGHSVLWYHTQADFETVKKLMCVVVKEWMERKKV